MKDFALSFYYSSRGVNSRSPLERKIHSEFLDPKFDVRLEYF